ncbi:MAG TPA: GTP-binding protein [Candidatus Udaeobacter sp.]|jgi:G3E family GTPase
MRLAQGFVIRASSLIRHSSFVIFEMLRTPITLITGPLGSGKTTLLRHILATRPANIAIVMNEFGEIAIDTKVIEGKNVRVAELGGGCVCCSLLGEFEAAVSEIIEKIAPEMIIVETTGLAEPEALVFNVQEALPQCRLDGVVSVIDADMLVRFPELGHTARLQIEGADILLLNKIDLVKPTQIEALETKLRQINPSAAIVRTERCRIDPELLFGIPQSREKKIARPEHQHQPEFESFAFRSKKIFSRDCFARFANSLPVSVVRAKGFVRFADGAQLFNFVAGRWDLEPFDARDTELVFIGKNIAAEKQAILGALDECIAQK